LPDIAREAAQGGDADEGQDAARDERPKARLGYAQEPAEDPDGEEAEAEAKRDPGPVRGRELLVHEEPDADAGDDRSADQGAGVARDEEDDEEPEADRQRGVAPDVGHELVGQQPRSDEDQDDAADPAPVVASAFGRRS
jgi:hypothetical protein